MAETKTTKARKPKTTVVEENKNTETNNDELIKQLMEQIQAQNEQMAKMQKEIENAKNSQPILVQQNNNMGGKKIKVINLMHNILNVSTEPNGQGRTYTFNQYGDHRMIKFDDLSDIVSSYPYTMEHGLLYIADKDAVEALGLTEEYKEIYSKEIMDKLVYLREEYFVDLFLGMEKNLQESTALEIARLINAGESMDYNYLRKIKDKTNIDIESIAEEIKKDMSNPNDGLA